MRDGWVEEKLGDVARVTSGFAFSTKSWRDKGIPVIKINNVRNGQVSIENCSYISEPVPEGASRFLLKQGDLLITLTGEIGAIGFVTQSQPMYLNQRVGRLDLLARDKVSLKFIGLFLSLPEVRAEMWSQGKGNAQLNISPTSIQSLTIKLPTLPEQKRIVDLISSVDSYIEALQQQLESSKRSRNAVLHELLTAGSDDWVETTLGEITDLVRGPFGGSLKKEIFVQEGFAVYEQQHAIYGDFSTIRYRISSEKFDEMKRFSLVPGDLIMSCSGTMGKVRIVPKEADPGIINQALLKIKPKSNLSSDFLYLWMQSDDFIRQIEMNSGGGALQNVSSVKMLKGIKLRVPSLLEQERIIGIISMIDEVIIKTELAICEAKNLRSGLLSDLLSGAHEIPASYDKVRGAA